MTDEQTMPDWVLIEAAKRAGFRLTPAQFRAGRIAKAARPYFLALCDMILKHEQPPVDRKLLCAREAMTRNVLVWSNSSRYRSGSMDDGPAVQDCLRAIELWEEGFGK
jgi:hypothetical protein